ncbi:MAG TPA: hypothetical protein VKK79_05465, partial [Candidatus Lokiarchaeia archaeon]|nr:hypothetical protein [Candidatus Lokiarchaeia archaeon]
MTILYIDANMQVRGTEIIEVEDSNIFSADLTKQIAEKLTDKITEVEEENVRLKEFLDFESDADFLATKTEPSEASDEEMDIKIEELAKETDKVIGQLLEGLAEIEIIEESADLEIEDLEVEEYSLPARKPRKPKQIKPRIKVKTPKGPKTSKRPKIDIFVASTIGPYGE